MSEARPEAEVIPFPRRGFIIGDHHCGKPGPSPNLICLAEAGHRGEHVWCDWDGCVVRYPGRSIVIPFRGFAG